MFVREQGHKTVFVFVFQFRFVIVVLLVTERYNLTIDILITRMHSFLDTDYKACFADCLHSLAIISSSKYRQSRIFFITN